MKLSFALLAVATYACSVCTTTAAFKPASEHLYHVTAPEVAFEQIMDEHGKGLDVWGVSSIDDKTVQVDVYARESEVAKLKGLRTPRNAYNVKGYMKTVNAADAVYSANTFFDCWRTVDQVFEFLDALTTANPDYISRLDTKIKTAEGRKVPGYKIAAGDKRWFWCDVFELQNASRRFDAIAAMLDGLRRGGTSIRQVVEQHDWYSMPIVNIDGYQSTWTNDRYWRKNRRPLGVKDSNGSELLGVDLNRNFGPAKYFLRTLDDPDTQKYPGEKPLSEPESAGVFKFVKDLKLGGVIDVHSFLGLVLRPLGVRAPSMWAIQPSSFLDAVFLLDNTASITFEMKGRDFVVPESTIRPGGQHIFQGMLQCARELEEYTK
ncbi:TPA: hypothetical protein N0F65_001372 [Lagenidium giganteum]|uniref:Peptidase M14 domain-containing protein n=1 Tax=Lagenidium giganteum TaxID=4803 RepID=A0AAV2Z0L2_9STRA|nr:TPA: hypothetical protein N0F65_001372 [Lagenidium giganteum]